ncbi:LacI family DNA-binding transcriptional regulator [Galbibacter sp. EGI 63066]|uniref:LacI family DNA-binding transcriptional regulator n=1 Tax=Galbibacter sp. EGI 63066 TaxID=2993559 RepID=UPI00224879B3|nr:LacI family DNA-binding transcriptional regulator [Galbibacter sp. EGI 63066]MCX2678400.1 LacI family DNA-binding transcriptional regulator [Galbibacter sp. EGI 63066]
MNEKTTIYDIAKALNITAATVSRALNNNPKISEATRKLVMETAAKMNYKQNKLALALKSGKSNNVGVVVPYIDRNFFSAIIRGIEEELYPLGYHVIICQTHELENTEIDNINALLNAQVDGILMSVSKHTEQTDHLNHVLNKNVPLVFFDRKKDINGVSTVTINDYEGGYRATKHLIEQGCKRIAHISGHWALEIYKHRFNGYKQALLDHGISYNKDYVIKAKSDISAGKKAVEKLLKLKNPPDAIFSSSDYVALGAIQELKEHGIKIPDDFCVVGFSNEPFTKFMELSITSVDQSPLDMGKMAAKVFLEQVKEANVKIEKKVVLTPTLKIRKSSSKIGKK